MSPLFVIFTFYISKVILAEDPVVETRLGRIRGLKATDGDYSMYLGIPYAKVNESNPFGLSIPINVFYEAYNAFDDSAMCPQFFENKIMGQLDCLKLNIYVPDSASTKTLSVIVWIHGGGLQNGFGGRYEYGPKHLMKHDVILVTMNYRLGPYGFMCLETAEVPGNQGHYDQTLALRWTKENIASFGGDGNKITVYGESAGATSIDYHLMYGQDGLIDQAIMGSGTAYMGYEIDPDPQYPIDLADKLGFETTDLSDALNFLNKAEPLQLVQASIELPPRYACIQKSDGNPWKFIPDYSVNSHLTTRESIPIMMGFNSQELVAYYSESKGKEYFDNLHELRDRLDLLFEFDDESYYNDMKDKVKQFYFGDEDIDIKVNLQIADFASDMMVYHPIKKAVQSYLENGAENIFFYQFSYVGDSNKEWIRCNVTEFGLGGASHSDEIGYLFDVSFTPRDLNPQDQLIVDRMTTIWTNFAKYGNPIPDISNNLPIAWEPITQSTSFVYLDINLNLTMKTDPFAKRMAFWDLFFELNEKYLKHINKN